MALGDATPSSILSTGRGTRAGRNRTRAPLEPVAPFYVALGMSDVGSLFRSSAEQGEHWPDLLYKSMPAETGYEKLGEQERTLSETNEKSLQAAIDSKPTILTLWQVAGDATSRTPLTAYLKELRSTLQMLVDETEATIYLLNLPDLSFLIKSDTEERKALVRGGVEQWNRVIAEVSISHGNRVHIVDLYPNSAEILDTENGNGALANLSPASDKSCR